MNMNDTCRENATCREIVTKQRLYERLENAIRQSEIIILKEEVRLETLRATKQNLDDYFEDELRATKLSSI